MRMVIHKLQQIMNTIIISHRHAPDDDYDRRFKLLQGLVAVFSPIAMILIIIRSLVLPDDTDNLFIMTVIGFIVIGMMYRVSRSHNYYLTMATILILGYTITVFHAVTTSLPHIEISYLLIIPLLATVMFTLLEVIAISSLTLIVVTLFVFTIGDIPHDIMFDLIAFNFVVLVFIVFAAYERNRLEQERQNLILKKHQAEILQHFLSNVSHDLKTPITTINTSLYLLEKSGGTSYQQAKYARIQNQTQHLEKLIQNMLTMSRLDNYENLSSMEWLNCNEVIRQSISALDTTVESKQITIKFDAVSDMDDVLANRDSLYSMFTNLIENAIIYTPQGGQIFVETHQSSTHITTKVRDTGIGINAADIPHIFDRFYRADKARSTHTGGAGLGLAIVKRTVELYGGNITVDSIENEGAVFTASLPLTKTNNRASL